MCEKCELLDQRIQQFRRFLAQQIDPLTAERLNTGVREMQAEKAGLHRETK